MPGLLRAVLCIIEAFHKYAREDEDKATLTCRELKQLLQGEIGVFLQPHVIHAVQRHLNLLDIDNDGTINFDEFVLAIFSLLNLCYLDIQSLLNSEPRKESKSEKGKTNNVHLQGITRNDQQMTGTLPTQEKVLLPSGIASSFQLSHKESEAIGNNKVNPREDKTHNLPREASEYLEGVERSQEVAQDVPATEDKRARIKRNKPLTGSEQTSCPAKPIPKEGAKPVRRPSGSKTNDRFEEQKENLKLQEIMQRPPDQEAAPEKSIKGHSKPQEPPLQGEDEPRSECADPLEAATRKPSQTQKSANPEDDRISEAPEPRKNVDRTSPETKDRDEPEDYGKTSDTQESPAQEKEHEIKDLPAQGDNKDISETPDIRAERKESRGLEAHGPAWQKECEKKTQPSVLEAQTQDRKDQELQRSSKQKDAEKDSETPDLSTEERNQNCPKTGGTSAPAEEVKHTEEGTAPAFVNSKNTPAARRTAGARERTQESAPLERQSEGENSRATKPCDKAIGEEDGYKGEDPEAPTALNSKGSCETRKSLVPEDGDRSSETSKLRVQGDSKSQAHPHKGSVQGSHLNGPDLWKHGAPGENRAQEAAVVLVREEGVRLLEGQEQPSRVQLKSHSTGTKSPDAAVEPSGPLELQKSTTKGKNRKSLQSEVPGGLDTNFTVTQLPKKGGSRKQLKTQGPTTKGEEEDRAPKIQEILFKSPGEDKSPFHKTHLEAEEPATLEEKNVSLFKPAGQSDDQRSQSMILKNYDSSIPLPGLEERMQTDQKPCSAQRDVIQSSALYQSLQEKIQQAREYKDLSSTTVLMEPAHSALANEGSLNTPAGELDGWTLMNETEIPSLIK
ncbi:PREDICTED: trichohyalin-like protein 1 [Chinchilla lanigera]|uniref:trichohyalin-like protein 1 n=1 Tax=Chinchilla lanigera TaxID=34839 RepID=UPI00038EAFAE|nr:PREDICTED: trichohyalin-like protein 1 [Chinchilla lanigera]